jgi:hypothetical protein
MNETDGRTIKRIRYVEALKKGILKNKYIHEIKETYKCHTLYHTTQYCMNK